MKRCADNNYDFFAPNINKGGKLVHCCEYHAYKWREYLKRKKATNEARSPNQTEQVPTEELPTTDLPGSGE